MVYGCNVEYICLMSVAFSVESTTGYWGRVMHICIDKVTIIGSDNGLWPGWRQAIIWTNVRMLLIGPLRTNFSEILNKFHTFSFKKMHLKMWSGNEQPFCLALNVLMLQDLSNNKSLFALKVACCNPGTKVIHETALMQLTHWGRD